MLEDDLRKQGLKLEELSATERVRLSKEFAEAWIPAYGQRQRQAVIEAAAAQFDPRKGDTGRRKFWMELATSA